MGSVGHRVGPVRASGRCLCRAKKRVGERRDVSGRRQDGRKGEWGEERWRRRRRRNGLLLLYKQRGGFLTVVFYIPLSPFDWVCQLPGRWREPDGVHGQTGRTFLDDCTIASPIPALPCCPFPCTPRQSAALPDGFCQIQAILNSIYVRLDWSSCSSKASMAVMLKPPSPRNLEKQLQMKHSPRGFSLCFCLPF